MEAEDLPPMPLAEWEDTRLRLQLMCQIAGKVRLKLHPFMNHWWHVPLYVSPRGLTTGSIPYQEGLMDLELDLLEHHLTIRSDEGDKLEIPITKLPICDFYCEVMDALNDLGAEVKIVATPYKCKSDIPFAQDSKHTTYDPSAVTRAWRVLGQIEPIFKEFRSRFVGKCSPVHMFWHSFDLAVTRFSGRPAPFHSDWDKVTQEAYSHEVNSAGFWFGDDNMREPMFYCYTSPSPEGLTDAPLKPKEAFWGTSNGSPMALYRYEDWRKAADPEQALLDFLQSSYEAGADKAKWDRRALER